MADMQSQANGQSSASLSTEQPPAVPAPLTVADVGGNVEDQWSAVINIDGGNLAQIEAALLANQHEVDPHPAQPGKYVRRHPVYLVAVDYSSGEPKPGKPLELDLQTIRGIFKSRYGDMVSDQDPPADGSHVRVRDAHSIAELDSLGNPTGRVTLGTPDTSGGATASEGGTTGGTA